MTRLEERTKENWESPDFDFEYLLIEVTEEIVRRMADLDVNRVQLSERLGVSGARVSQILSGDQNLTVRSLVAVANALDSRIVMSLGSRSRTAVQPEPPVLLRLDSSALADDEAIALAA